MLIFALVFAASFPGVASAQLFKFGKKKETLPVVFRRTPTQAELVQHITNNNSKFRQLSSDLRVSLDGTPKLRGTMQLELPRRLRIKAGVMGVSQFGVDVGSNEQDFWVWTKVNLPKPEAGDLPRQPRRFQKRKFFRSPGDPAGARLVARRVGIDPV